MGAKFRRVGTVALATTCALGFGGLPAARAAGPASPVIVVLRSRPTAPVVARLRALGGDLRLRHTYRGLPAIAATLDPTQIAALEASNDVVDVVADRTIRLEPDATTPGQMSAPTPIRKADKGINAAQTKLGLTGDIAGDGIAVYGPGDAVIAVVDSGIDPTHPDFAGKILAFQNFVSSPGAGCPAPPANGDPWDDLGHGTHVAGIAAGTGAAKAANKGVAPGAALVVLKIFDCANSAPESDILAAFDWLITNRAAYGIDVVNMSFGASWPGLDGTDVLSIATNRLAAAGMVPVVAAGNSGPGSGSVSTPGVARWAITAGAIKSNALGRNLAEFSSRGPTADGRIKPDALTPGVDIVAAAPGGPTWRYRMLSGTSMATPALAGMVALALDADPTLAPSGAACAACPNGVDDTAMQSPIADLVHASAADWNVAGPDADTGNGVLNAYPFLQAAANSTVRGPAVPRHYARLGHVDDRTEQVWPVRAVRNRTVGVGLSVPAVDGFNGPFTRIVVFGPDGRVVPFSDDCSSSDFGGGGSSSLCWINGGAARSTGGWFTPTVSGTHYIGIRSLTGATDYVLDVDAPTAMANSGDPLVVTVPAQLAEGAAGATVSVHLARAPLASTTVALRGDGQLTLPVTTLTFTAQNWSVPQTATIAAGDDALAEGDHAGRLVFTALSTKFDDSAASVPASVRIVDNDTTANSDRVERVSLTDADTESWGGAYEPAGMMALVTPGGRFVAFESRAVDLTSGPDENGIRNDVFLRDRLTGTTERITVGGTFGDNLLQGISDDGTKVLFSSYDSFGTVDTNDDFDLFVRDRVAGTTTRVNLDENGNQMPTRVCRTDWTAFCWEMPGSLSGDGTTVAFVTDAAMVASDTDGAPDVYVRNLASGAVERVSVASDETTGLATVRMPSSMTTSLSNDGSVVGFGSATDGLAPNDRPGELDLFIRDRVAGTTQLVNVAPDSSVLPIETYNAAVLVSSDGSHVAFASLDPTTYEYSLWVVDLVTGIAQLAVPAAQSWTMALGLSADGRSLTFYTDDPSLTGTSGTLIRNLDTEATRAVVTGMLGLAVQPALARTSSDATYAVWIAADGSVVSGDTNDTFDVFLHTLG